MFVFDAKAPIVLVGGGGVVGRRLAPLLTSLEEKAVALAASTAPGVNFPEQDPENARLVELVERGGVKVTWSSR